MKKFLMGLLLASTSTASIGCNTFKYPNQVEAIKEGVGFFYTRITLENNQVVKNGFEFDGDRWEVVEQQGTPKKCQSQWDYFQHITMMALTERSCGQGKLRYPETSDEVKKYKSTLNVFCMENQK